MHVSDSPAKRYQRYSQYGKGTQAVFFDAAPGEHNRLTVTSSLGNGPQPAGYELTDAGADLTAGDGCEQVDQRTVTCNGDLGSIRHAEVRLGDGDDTLEARALVTAFGGTGDDRLHGSGELFGGDGSDVLRGRAGEDALNGGDGSGDDRDVIDGSYGFDLVSYASHRRGVVVDLRGESQAREVTAGAPGEGDRLRRINAAWGGHGRDRLVARRGGSELRGKGGSDLVLGSGADDFLQGNGGRDRLVGRGGGDDLRGGPAVDSVECGAGTDTVHDPSPLELVRRNCESADNRDAFGGEQRLLFEPNPRSISRRAAVFAVGCPVDLSALNTSRDPVPPCKARIAVRTRSGALLARGRYASSGSGRLVRVRLTELGRALTGRRHGVLATVSVGRFRSGDSKVTVAWTIRLRRGSG